MKHVGAAIRYVSGYASKTDQTRPGESVGRYWGVVGRERIPWGEPQRISLNSREAACVRRAIRRHIASVNRSSRIRRVGKLVCASAAEIISSGWFDQPVVNWGKHIRGCGAKMPQKLRLRNLRSMNVFLDADFWAASLPRLLMSA